MPANGKVKWYGDEMMLTALGASDEMLAEFAFNTEGVAKTGAPVDTGFMRNAIYSITPQGNTRQSAAASSQASADRPLAPAPRVGPHEAATHAAAEYTIYQEERHGFIYAALQDTASKSNGVITATGAKHFG